MSSGQKNNTKTKTKTMNFPFFKNVPWMWWYEVIFTNAWNLKNFTVDQRACKPNEFIMFECNFFSFIWFVLSFTMGRSVLVAFDYYIFIFRDFCVNTWFCMLIVFTGNISKSESQRTNTPKKKPPATVLNRFIDRVINVQ